MSTDDGGTPATGTAVGASPGTERRPAGGLDGAASDDLFERLRGYEGRPAAAAAHGPDPVNTVMIRHWCEALGHPVPPDGSAPATMLQVWTMAGPAGGGTGRAGPYDELLRALDEAGYTSVVATDCEQEYLRPLRPGEEIGFDAVIESVSPRKTTKLGTGYFVTTRMEVRADGEPAGTHRFRILKYRPAQGPGAGRLVRDTESGGSKSRDTASPQGNPALGKPHDSRPQDAKPRAGRPLRPRPVVNRDNAGFWEGVARGELLHQRCDDCGTPRFPWLPGCNACGSPKWTPVASAGHGTVYSYVVMHHPPFPAFDPPYAVALIELDEGVRIVSNLTGVALDGIRIGMPVELEFLRVDDELVLPVFRAAAEGGA